MLFIALWSFVSFNHQADALIEATFSPSIPLPTKPKEEGIRYSCIKLGKNSALQGDVHPTRSSASLKSWRSSAGPCTPLCLCPGCCCSPYLLFQQFTTFWKCAFIFWWHQLRRPLDKQARIGMSGTVSIRTGKICKAASEWGAWRTPQQRGTWQKAAGGLIELGEYRT